MLHNKKLFIPLAIMLIAVIVYNYHFFAARQTKSVPVALSPVPAASRSVTADPNRLQASSYRSSWRRDPFWYKKDVAVGRPAAKTIAARKAPAKGFHFEGTLTEHGQGFALVSGQIVGVGAMLYGYTVLEVGDRSITVKSSEGVKTMRIADDSHEKEN